MTSNRKPKVSKRSSDETRSRSRSRTPPAASRVERRNRQKVEDATTATPRSVCQSETQNWFQQSSRSHGSYFVPGSNADEMIEIVPRSCTVKKQTTHIEEHEVYDKIVHKKVPVIVEKIVEVPEIVENIIEIEQIVEDIVENIVEVENIIEVEKVEKKIIRKEIVKEVEVETRERVDVPFENIKPETRSTVESVPVKLRKLHKDPVEVQTPRYIPDVVNTAVVAPVPVEATTTVTFNVPDIVKRCKRAKYPVYLPRFIEVPVFARQDMIAGHKHLGEELITGSPVEASAVCELQKCVDGGNLSSMDITNRDVVLRTLNAAYEEGKIDTYIKSGPMSPFVR